MSAYDNQYLDIVEDILNNGEINPCRTGNNTLVRLNKVLTWDLKDGFPMLTFRQQFFKSMKGEVSCFLEGITSKKVFVERGCGYWKEWCNPKKVPAGLSDEERKAFQLQENDLGNIYGFNYRHFGAKYIDENTDYTGQGFDQLQHAVDTLKKNPYDRRLLITALDPANADTMGLPPCVYVFQFNYLGGRLHITVNQRSADTILGVPTDLSFYALLLHLMCQTVNMEPGTVTLNLCNCHIYDNHVEKVKEMLPTWRKEQYELPKLVLDPSATVFNFMPDMASLEGYQHGERVKFDIAV